MTLRRASGYGTRVWQIVADLYRLPSAARYTAMLLGSLLPGCALHAATHAPHTHRSVGQSAGKAPAHFVHDTGSHDSGLHSSPHTEHTAKRRGAREDPTHQAAPSSRHTGKRAQDGDRKHAAKAHTGRKRREPQFVDDPQPVRRAQSERRNRGIPPQPVETHPARAAQAGEQAAGTGRAESRTLPEDVLPTGTGRTPGDVARNKARYTVQDQSPLSFPIAAHPPQKSAPIVHASVLSGPGTAMTAAAPLDATDPTSTGIVEGFGAEVDFHAPRAGSEASRLPAVVMPRESPAQEERDLRTAAEIASQPMFVPLYSREGKLIVPPPLKGSREILVHQNQMADDAGLSRIQDDADLNRMRRAHLLMDIPESVSLRVNENLPENRRSARPWAVKFASEIAHAFYARFGEPLQVNSAVRTVAYQLRLQRVNGNAAAAEGDGASPHLTGQALDFGKRGMSVAEIAWMRSYLLPLIDAGKVDVEEEFQQACFHISVYASYQPSPGKNVPVRTAVAQIGNLP